MKLIAAHHTVAEARSINEARAAAEDYHRGQKRKSGDPYVAHVVTVAEIVAELGADAETICAALLHDVLDDTDCPEHELRRRFGTEVTGLVLDVMRQDHTPTAPVDRRAVMIRLGAIVKMCG